MSEHNPRHYNDAFIKAAQYIARLTAQQDLLEELGNIIVKYFGADWVAFAGDNAGKEIDLHRCTAPDEAFGRTLLQETREAIRDVLDTGFLASIEIGHAPARIVTLLPVGEARENRVAAIVGHRDPPSQELLNLYLALSGLAGSTMGRISTERALRLHQGRLEELVRERTAKLEKEIVQRKRAEETVQEQRERLRVTLASIGDAVIATDQSGRITFMNAVAEGLTGWAFAESAGKPTAKVFHIINEQTRTIVDDPVARVLREGTIVGLANHTILVKKDGTEVPIDDSGAPIKDVDGSTMGVVLVFRDITERKRASDVLQSTMQRFYAILSNSYAAILLATDDGVVELANRAFCDVFGLSDSPEELKGITDREMIERIREVYLDPKEAVARIRQIVEEGKPVRGEEIALTSGRVCLRDFVPIRVEGRSYGRAWYHLDITVQKAAEEAVLQKEAELSEAQRIAHLGSWYWDAVTDVTTGSDELLRIYGFDPQTQLMPNFRDQRGRCYPAEDWERVNVAVQRTLKTGVGYELDVTALRSDGTAMTVMTRSEVARDANGDVKGLRGTVQDITDRKLREERITRLTSLYAMLSRVNECIVRARDQAVMYEEVCRIIAKEGAFPLVWIGEVNDGRVAPAASCGPAVDYLSEIHVETDGEFGQGPTGTCVREDRPVINDDFHSNTATAPWRQSALRRGFRTSAAFPLHCRDKVVAALTLYAPRPRDFDAEQVELLQSLAADVSYALDTMEQEKLRTRAETDLHRSLRRFELLAHTSEQLLQSPDPQGVVNSLCRDVMEYLDCHAFFNFLAVEEAGRLKLNAYAGIPEEAARKIEWLDYGVAVCGCAARDACRIVAEHIPTTPDPRTDLVKSYGIKAYACHPLPGPDGKPLGALSFGTCGRETFSDEDLSLMKAVADQAAVAMVRMRDKEALRESRDNLERRVEERTAEVNQALETIRAERQRLYGVLETLPAMICLLTPDHHVAFANRSFREKFGESGGRHCYEYCFGYSEPCDFCESYKVLETGAPHHWEVTTPDGSSVIDAYDFPFTDVDGSPLILEMDIDITDQRRAEEEKVRLERQLRQAHKLEALGTLSGGIAHDFNNMLAAIVGFAELIKDHVPKESRERRHAQRILDAGVRGRELVRQMLTFSRQTEQEKKPLRLSSIVKESVKLLRASIPSTISIRVGVKSESGVILGDPVQIQQVLMNLATNAAYAMRDKGGALDIELSDFSVSPSNGNSDGIEPGLYMKLSVRDTGVGIPPDIVDRIFDPFFTTKEVGEGTGLGLSVVLGIVRQAEGHITVESEPGRGSTFDIYFPKVLERSTIEGVSVDETVPVGHERILFVDDEEALVEMGEELLAELGYEVTCRTNSREALALFRLDPSRFDLVLTDQTMPEMTGVQLAMELIAIRPDIPIILCTGFSHTANEESAKAAGIRGFVMKPLTKRELAKAVRTVIDG